MLCTNCRMDTATTKDGLCGGCTSSPVDFTPPVPPVAHTPRRADVFRSPVGLSHAVVALLCFVILADVFSIAAAVNLRSLQSTVQDGGFEAIASRGADRADMLTGHAANLQAIGYLATGVLFIIWFHRVRANAEVFAPDVHRRGRGWAIGGWFVPIGNLFIPRGIAADIWAASSQDPYGAGQKERHTLLNVWWITWLVSGLVDGIAGAQYDDAETADALRTAGDALVVGGLVDIAAALLAVAVVRRLTGMQCAKAVRRAEEVAV